MVLFHCWPKVSHQHGISKCRPNAAVVKAILQCWCNDSTKHVICQRCGNVVNRDEFSLMLPYYKWTLIRRYIKCSDVEYEHSGKYRMDIDFHQAIVVTMGCTRTRTSQGICVGLHRFIGDGGEGGKEGWMGGREGEEGRMEGREGREGGARGEGGREGRQGRHGRRNGGEGGEGGREGRGGEGRGGEGRGGMTVIHIVIGMFTSNPMIPQYLNNILT